MKCTDLLIQDHKVILRCLRCCAADGGVRWSTPVEKDVVCGFLRAFADEHHQ
jgi:hypothetical protein